jgi:heme exporter protein D
MNSFFEWVSMGGYSAYVWPAYGLVSLVLLSVFLSVKAQKKRTQKKLQHWFKS